MRHVALVAVVSLSLMACDTVGSLHSAVESDAVMNDDRLLGTWIAVGDEADTARVRVTRISETQYDLAITDENESYSREARLAPLGDRWLLEMSAQGEGRDAIERNGGLMTYSHAVVEFGDSILRTAFFDGDELLKALTRESPPRLEYLLRINKNSEYTSKDILLTSPPAALRAGLEHFSNDTAVAGEWVVWRRQ